MATNTSIQNMPGWENAVRGYEAKHQTRKVLLEHGTDNASTERSSPSSRRCWRLSPSSSN
ncbi:MAG TPA: hypothetical protein VHS99_23660 [Chloroflexota bacterium]|nr:hypothetical protein [Chloroflexota bacterium]